MDSSLPPSLLAMADSVAASPSKLLSEGWRNVGTSGMDPSLPPLPLAMADSVAACPSKLLSEEWRNEGTSGMDSSFCWNDGMENIIDVFMIIKKLIVVCEILDTNFSKTFLQILTLFLHPRVGGDPCFHG